MDCLTLLRHNFGLLVDIVSYKFEQRLDRMFIIVGQIQLKEVTGAVVILEMLLWFRMM
jgi:hypothetical protein